MARYAVLDAGDNVQSFVLWDGSTPFNAGDGLRLVAAPDGWGAVDGKLVQLPAPATPAPAPRFVPFAVVCDRVRTAGLWAQFVQMWQTLSPADQVHLLTLTEGVAPDDAAVTAALHGIGADPAVILAA